MKKSAGSLIYPIVLLSVCVTAGLQVAWLYQLYQDQTVRIKEKLELVVRDAAHQQMMLSVQKNATQSASFKEFFGSDEWIQLRQSFDDMNVMGLRSSFHYGFTDDSVKISLGFAFPTKPDMRKVQHGKGAFNRESPQELKVIEQASVKEINSLVSVGLANVPLKDDYSFRIYDYNDNRLLSGPKPNRVVKDFVSKRYSYNLKHLHKYQLVVPRIKATVLYSMRYYLLSALMMLLLTVAAFYVLLRLMRNQKLYAEARQAFTSNMTHELKTPVATVSVALESIEKYDLVHHPKKLKDYLEISRHELQRLNLMIEKVLSLETGDSSAAPRHPELFDVQQVLQDAIYGMTLQFDNEGGYIKYKPSQEPCFMHGNPLQMSHVFYNLMDNALKYAGPAARLDIVCEIVGAEVVVSFGDNGKGIPADYHHRIFERYFRIPGFGDRHDVKGSGLGLNYVREVIEQHGGSVAVKSGQEMGTTFILNLPAHEL